MNTEQWEELKNELIERMHSDIAWAVPLALKKARNAEKIPELQELFSGDEFCGASLSVSMQGIGVGIKPARLEQVKPFIAALRQSGFRKVTALLNSATPSWDFYRQEDELNIILTADFSRNTSDDHARYEKVGTEKKEVDVMRLTTADNDIDLDDEEL